MHGFIFTEIRKFVTSNLGSEAWAHVLKTAGLGDRDYLNGVHYPDEEAVQIVATASQVTGMSVADILQSFGKFLGADLFKTFRPLISPSWRTLEFLENVEETVHQVVRARNRQSRPPALVCERVGDREVIVHYSSARQLNALAVGIVQGVAEHYGEEVDIEVADEQVQNGVQACKIHVRLTAVARQPVGNVEPLPFRSP